MKKRITAFFLSSFMLLGTTSHAFYQERDFEHGQEIADKLYELGLVQGVGTNADGSIDHGLEQELTKIEMTTLLVRLLGKEAEAESLDNPHPFTDVPEWGDMYADYAYNNGLINGVSSDTMGANDVATDTMYHTVLLRALGYTDADDYDFTWDSPYDLSYFVGIRPVNLQEPTMLRSDALVITASALFAEFKGSDKMLYEQLAEDGVIDIDIFNEVFSEGNPFNDDTLDGYFATTDAMIREFEAYEEFGDPNMDYANKMIFTTDVPVAKVEFYGYGDMTFDEVTNEMTLTTSEKIYESTTFSPENPIVTWMTFPGSMSNYSIICTYPDGTTQGFGVFGHGGPEHFQLSVGETNIVIS